MNVFPFHSTKFSVSIVSIIFHFIILCTVLETIFIESHLGCLHYSPWWRIVLSNSCLEALFYKLNRWALWIWIFLRFLLHIDNSSSWNGGSVSITPTSALTSSSVLGYGGNGKRLDYTVDLWTTRCELCGFTYTQSFFNKYCKRIFSSE